ncbi:MAG: ribonuclease HII [Chloroflexota bacterium]|nr:ribonuclease HII [Dehalococcoidia bacterium]MDW8254446.1 ribonuclease HII [Chloroflexota bacterium]
MVVVRTWPTREQEDRFFAAGHALVAGVDEVGRGPLAGPVVAAAVLAPPDAPWDLPVADSKQLTASERERLAAAIVRALPCALGLATVAEIDDLGVAAATRLAMMRAVRALPQQPTALLIDAVALPGLRIEQRAIVRGDTCCWTIAAASVVAKVERDRLMYELDRRYPDYGLARHKGYATAEHLEALARLGPTPEHRRSFAPLRLSLER